MLKFKRMRWTLPLLVASASLGLSATVETVDGRRYSGDVQFATNGNLHLRGNVGEPGTFIPLSEVRVANFTTVTTDLSDFTSWPDRWSPRDIGLTPSSSRSGMSNGMLVIRVASRDIGGREDSFHFGAHPLPGDGEIIARVVSLQSGDLAAKGGLMIRGGTNIDAPFAFARVTASGRVSFQHRDQQGGLAREIVSSETQGLPAWLRLERQSNTFVAAHSPDGGHWKELGRATLALESPASIGVALASHGELSAAVGAFDSIHVSAQGVLGEYFRGKNWQRRVFTSLDRNISLPWKSGVRDPRLGEGPFSVRWSGTIVPAYSESYRFSMEGSAKLWIDDKPVGLDASNGPRPGAAVGLVAGRRHPFRLEYEAQGTPAAELKWASATQSQETIPDSRLWCSFHLAVPIRTNAPAALPAFVGKGILLRDGSFLAGEVTSVTPRSAVVEWESRTQWEVPIHHVAAIILRLPNRATRLEPGGDRTGVLLQNGDFFDGDVEVRDRQIMEVDSVLFGRRSYPLDSGEVIAVLKARVVPMNARYQFRTLQGSVFSGTLAIVGGGDVAVQNRLLGSVRLATTNIAEVRAGPAQ